MLAAAPGPRMYFSVIRVVKRRQPGRNVECEQRLDLRWIKRSWAPDHLGPS
jgi:hypothetical protein